MSKPKELERYEISADEVNGLVKIVSGEDFVTLYKLVVKKPDTATSALLNEVRSQLITQVNFAGSDILNPRTMDALKIKFKEKADELLSGHLPNIRADDKAFLRDVMVENVISIPTGSTLKEAAQEFSRYGFRALPVVDDENRLFGVIPYRDVMNLTHHFIE